MPEKGALKKIFRTMTRHPNDGKIRLAHSEAEVAVAYPLVRDGFAKAVIIPYPDPEGFALRTRALLGQGLDQVEGFFKPGNSLDYDSIYYKDEQIWRDEADDYDITGTKPVELEVTSTQGLPSVVVESFSRIIQSGAEIIKFLPVGFVQKGEDSPTPAFHCDDDDFPTAHISGFNPIDYVTGRITRAQHDFF